MAEDHCGCHPSYSLSITSKCNWDCSYCCVDTHNREEPTVEMIRERLSLIPAGAKVTLTGGEPGMVTDEVMTMVLDDLTSKGCELRANTNGQFFRAFPQHVHLFHDFTYHCSYDLRNRVWLPPNHEQLDIDYVVVVTDQNYDRLESFLKKNDHVSILVYSADKRKVHGKWGDSLSIQNRIRLYRDYKQLIRQDNLEWLFDSNHRVKTCSEAVKLG